MFANRRQFYNNAEMKRLYVILACFIKLYKKDIFISVDSFNKKNRKVNIRFIDIHLSATR